MHTDYPQAQFQFELLDGTTIGNSFVIPQAVRVFNSDFIRDNVRWDDSELNSVSLSIGVESTELKKVLEIAQTRRQKAISDVTIQEQQKSAKTEVLDVAATGSARTVGESLRIRYFNRTNFISYADRVKDSPEKYILDETQFGTLRTEYESPMLEAISPVSFRNTNLKKLAEDVGAIIERKVTSGDKIQELIDSPELGAWVESGRELHRDRETCGYCGNIITEDRILKLNEHFSKEFERLEAPTGVEPV